MDNKEGRKDGRKKWDGWTKERKKERNGKDVYIQITVFNQTRDQISKTNTKPILGLRDFLRYCWGANNFENSVNLLFIKNDISGNIPRCT